MPQQQQPDKLDELVSKSMTLLDKTIEETTPKLLNVADALLNWLDAKLGSESK